jgi:hypothetical protein
MPDISNYTPFVSEACLGVKYPDVPANVLRGICDYVNHRIPAGGFVTAALENRFVEVVGRADRESLASLVPIATLLYQDIPAICWGSPDAVEAWLRRDACST